MPDPITNLEQFERHLVELIRTHDTVALRQAIEQPPKPHRHRTIASANHPDRVLVRVPLASTPAVDCSVSLSLRKARPVSRP